MNERLLLTTTNWKYKGLPIYRDPDGNFYISYWGEIYPINFQELPKTIKYDADNPLEKMSYTITGKIGVDQE